MKAHPALIAAPTCNAARAHNAGVIDALERRYRKQIASLVADYNGGWQKVAPLPKGARL